MNKKARRNMKSLKGIAIIALVAILSMASFFGCATSVNPKTLKNEVMQTSSGTIEDVTEQYSSEQMRQSNFDMTKVKLKDTDPAAKRWIIVEFEGDSVSERYFSSADSKNQSLQEYSITKEAEAVRSSLEKNSEKVLKRISKAGIDYVLKYNYSLLANGAALQVREADIPAVQAVNGVKAVTISERYNEPAAFTENDANVYKTGIYDTSELDYSGKGMLVAVLDTGVDESHEAFRQPINKYKDEADPSKGEYDVVGKNDIETLLINGGANFKGNVSINDVYLSEKIPYAYDYADYDTDVFPQYSSHGNHVAGIIAGGRIDDVKDADGRAVVNTAGEAVDFVGVAPNAQLAIFKVFTDNEFDDALGGADTINIVAALEDCVRLKVDVINMSLGSSVGFSEATDEFLEKDVYASIKAAGISLVVAASNDFSSGYGGPNGTNLTSSPDSGTVGSPSTYDGALSVASINGQKSPFLIANPGTAKESYAYFSEASDGLGNQKNFIDDLFAKKNVTSSSLDIEYVVIPGYGKSINYTGKDVTGKIALVSRGGEVTFQEKQEVAKERGAAGVVIYNNVSGTIRMSLGEDKTPIPACSITMDMARLLLDNAAGGKGILRIDKKQAAGPFMSDFSSWGPTPDLRLKPEITAHGGSIISAVAGGGWSEYSGTSMAAPNMAGAMSVLLQHISDNAAALGVENDKVATVALANQLAMSTATIANNEFGDPYFTRKQGAGLANIKNAISTDAYIYTKDADGEIKDKTKIELGDDMNRTGVYKLQFYVKNISSVVKSYKIKPVVMTETVASDGRTVAERSKVLQDSTTAITGASGDTLTVAVGETKSVSVTITLSNESKAYLNNSFKNGMYVEGFVNLIDQSTENIVDLGVPWLAYYGNWYDSSMMDLSEYQLAETNADDSIEDRDKPKAEVYGTLPLATYWNNQYIMPMGMYLYVLPDGYKEIYSSEEKAAISMFDTEGRRTMYEFYAVYGGFKRNAKEVSVEIVDDLTGETVYSEHKENVRKGYSNGGSARPSYVGIEQQPYAMGLKNNRKYTFSMTGIMDSLGDFDNGNEARLAPGKGNTKADEEALRTNTFTFSFTVDYEAPTITDYRVRYVPYTEGKVTKYRSYLDVDVYDNHFAQSLLLCYPNSNSNTLTLLNDTVLPIYSQKNSQTTVTIDITDYIDSNEDLYIQVEDYAMNARLLRIADFKSIKSTANFPELISFVDGESVTIDINQAYTLGLNVQPLDAAKNNLAWSSSNNSVVKVKNGEIFGLKEGTAKITVYGAEKASGSVKATISVTVANTERHKASVSKIRLDLIKNKSNSFVDPTNAFVEVNPGQYINLRTIIEPWYSSGTPEIQWKSSNNDVAEVNSSGRIKTMKEGRATITGTLMQDGRASIYTVSVTLSVGPEFDVSSGTLYEYFGWGGKVVIPPEQNVYAITKEAFKKNNNITELEISSPTTTIEIDAFKEMTELRRLVLPASLEYIATQAFRWCEKLERIDFRGNSVLVGSYAFAGCPALKELNSLNITDPNVDPKKISILSLNESQYSLTPIRFTSLKKSAFSNCNALETVDISLVRTAEPMTFANCTSLKKVILSKDTYISDNMFFGCTSLTEIEVIDAESYEDIFSKWGRAPFEDCPIDTLTLSNGTSLISDASGNIFADVGKTHLVYGAAAALDEGVYTLPSTVTVIGKNSLSGNPAMTSIDFSGAMVLEIADYAFSGSGLTSITLPSSVTKLGAGVFMYCKNLNTADLSALQIEKLPDYTFAVSGLTHFTLNKTAVNELGHRAFYGTSLGIVQISDHAIKTLGDEVFAFCFGLTTAELPALTKIGYGTFMAGADGNGGAAKLKTVSFAEGTTTLGTATFLSSVPRLNFTSLSLPDSVKNGLTEVGYATFAGCVALTTIPLNTLTKVASLAFYNCKELTTMNLSNVVSVGESAFENCEALNNVDLSKAKVIGDYAFDYCLSLSAANLAATEEVGDYAFATTNVSSLTLTEKLSYIGECAFYQTRLGGTVNIPKSVKYIGEGAFSDISTATAFAITNDATTNGAYFVANDVLYNVMKNGKIQLLAYPAGKTGESFIVGKEIVRICASAFEGAKNLKSVTITQNVTNIGDRAFYAAYNLETYIFDMVKAPTLEFDHVMVESLSNTDVMYKIFSWSVDGKNEDRYYSNFYTYMGFILNKSISRIETPNLAIEYPANAKGFDNVIWNTFFKKKTLTAIKADAQTELACSLISGLASNNTVNALKSQTDKTAAKATLAQYSSAAQAARAAYKVISNEDQLSLIDNYSKLLETEAAIREVSAFFGQQIAVEKITVQTKPIKTSYNAGETFDPTGLVLNIVFKDGSEIRITEGYTYDTSKFPTGTNSIEIKYGGKTCSVSLSVSGEYTEPDKGCRSALGDILPLDISLLVISLLVLISVLVLKKRSHKK